MKSGEFGFIKALAEFAGKHPQSLNLGDDGAIITCADNQMIVVKDMVQAGVHALPDDTHIDIVRKAIRVNLSDLAAMGASAEFILLGLCFDQVPDADSLAKAIGLECERFGVGLIGGDTVLGQGPFCVSVTAIGKLSGPAILRSGARPGDDVWVSGTLGDGALGLHMLQSGKDSSEFSLLQEPEKEHLISRYRWPEPRLDTAQALGRMANAMIDISDGLGADAFHIAKASNVGMHIHLDAIPRSDAFMRWQTDLPEEQGFKMLFGGDDYELLFTANPARREQIAAIDARCPLTRIGVVTEENRLDFFCSGKPVELTGAGFTHF